MSIDKRKLQKLLWAEAASYRADCADWKRNTEALQEFLGDKTVEEVALELLAENERLATQVRLAGVSAEVTVHQEVGRAITETLALAIERDQLKAENEALQSVITCVVSEIPNHTSRNGNAPGHCHAIPGVWDQGNGAKSGTECAWCKVWNAATAMSKERPLACGSEQGSISAETPAQQRSACRSENP